jgi:hypothetical protein
MRFNKWIFGLCASALLTLSAPAQTTNSLGFDVSNVLQDLGLSSNPTNYAAATFAGHSLKGNEWSAGVLVVENVNNNVGICAGVDSLWGGGKIGSANIVAGGLNLKLQTHPLSFLGTNAWEQIAVTPFGIAMVGTPLGGTGSANGGLCAVNRAGFEVDLANISGWKIGASIDYGNRTGAGNYSGNWADFGISARKGF